MKKLFILSLGLLLLGKVASAEQLQKGEFLNHCAQGLTMGKMIHTTCSVSWLDPSSKKTYCFSNKVMKNDWAKDTEGNIKKAEANFTQLEKNHGEAGHSKAEHGHDDHEHEMREIKG